MNVSSRNGKLRRSCVIDILAHCLVYYRQIVEIVVPSSISNWYIMTFCFFVCVGWFTEILSVLSKSQVCVLSKNVVKIINYFFYILGDHCFVSFTDRRLRVSIWQKKKIYQTENPLKLIFVKNLRHGFCLCSPLSLHFKDDYIHILSYAVFLSLRR